MVPEHDVAESGAKLAKCMARKLGPLKLRSRATRSLLMVSQLDAHFFDMMSFFGWSVGSDG